MASTSSAVAASDDTLETWLNKATNPMMKEENWEAIVGFCDQIQKDLEGPQTAVRLLVHKIQSPQEKESLFALTTLEACVKNCGRRFQQEIGKFRFINELIKVVSPKYLGNQMSYRVKEKVIELLYSWSQVLVHEPKIKEAYQMLRRQGIIKQDPAYVDRTLEVPPAPAKNSIFEDEEKSKLLSRLLKSKNPEDLQAANRLIKNMVKQDAERTEKVCRRNQQLDTVSNNVKLLSEMLSNHHPGNSTESDREIIKELYDNIEKQRPGLFRLASDSDERDSSGLTDILKANEEVIQVMALYDSIINKSDVGSLLAIDDNKEAKAGHSFLDDLTNVTLPQSTLQSQASLSSLQTQTSLLDEQLLSLGIVESSNTAVNGQSTDFQFEDLDELFGAPLSNTSNTDKKSAATSGLPVAGSSMFASSAVNSSTSQSMFPMFPTTTATPASAFPSSTYSNSLDFLTLQPPIIPNQPVAGVHSGFAANSQSDTFLLSGGSVLNPSSSNSGSILTNHNLQSGATAATSQARPSAGLDTLNELSFSLLQETLTHSGLKPYQPAPTVPKVPLNQMAKSNISFEPQSTSRTSTSTGLIPSSVIASPKKELINVNGSGESMTSEPAPITDIFVPLESIQLGSTPPLVIFEKNGIKIVFHFGKDRPRPDVQVIAVSVTSTCQSPVKEFAFQAAVPKVMKIKLQPASATEMNGYNPILPPSAITQVMLIANPHNEKIRLKFKISYSVNDASTTEVGEVDTIPV